MVVAPGWLDQVPNLDFGHEKELLTAFETWAEANGWIVSDGESLPEELQKRTDVLLEYPSDDKRRDSKRLRLAVLRKSRSSGGVICVDASNLRTVELLFQRKMPHWRVEAAGVRVEDDLLVGAGHGLLILCFRHERQA